MLQRSSFPCACLAAPIHKLLILFALLGFVHATIAAAESQPAAQEQPRAPTSARQSSLAAAAKPQLYIPFIKTPPPCVRLYSDTSPWNMPISANAEYDPLSSIYIAGFSGIFGSDPTQYTYPVYEIDAATPKQTVAVSGYFSNVVDDVAISNLKSSLVGVPMPPDALPSTGDDGQMVFWNRQTGDEWGLSGAVLNADDTWTAWSGYHYNTNWDAAPPIGSSQFASRGAGLPFMAGLVRKCEVAQGHIDHALAFAYDSPSPLFVYPATRSDGDGNGLPEGARVQLDPALTDQQIQAWGCTGSCLVIAHALQKYGMIVVDRSDHPKIYAEDDQTAHWYGTLNAKTISKIPYSAFKVLKIVP